MTITIDLPPIPAAKAGSGIDRELAPFIARAAGIRPDDVPGYRIVRKSIDARKKPASTAWTPTWRKACGPRTVRT